MLRRIMQAKHEKYDSNAESEFRANFLITKAECRNSSNARKN